MSLSGLFSSKGSSDSAKDGAKDKDKADTDDAPLKPLPTAQAGSLPPFGCGALESPSPTFFEWRLSHCFPSHSALLGSLLQPRTGITRQNRSYHMKTYSNCFLGSELVDWLCTSLKTTDRTQMTALGQEMLEARIFHHVFYSEPFRDGHFFYRFQCDEATQLANFRMVWSRESRPAIQVATSLRNLCMSMKGTYMKEDGSGVDYQALAQSREWAEFEEGTGELQMCNPLALSHSEALSFWINLYNFMVVHAIIVLGAPKGAPERASFFSRFKYLVGGMGYSLSDVENGVLRGNQKPPYSLNRPFKKEGDSRALLALVRREPRIHFALVCGAKSCPPIRVYSPEKIDAQLDMAAKSFCAQEVSVSVEKEEIELSKIFSWYRSDFAETDLDLVKYLLPFTSGDLRNNLQTLLDKNKFRIKYRSYDWGLNSS